MIGMQFRGLELNYSSSSDYESTAHPRNARRYFQRIFIKRDNINNVGELICFPMPPLGGGGMDSQILIAGGLNVGMLSGKSHVYDCDKMKVNFDKSLEMPIPDLPKYFY